VNLAETREQRVASGDVRPLERRCQQFRRQQPLCRLRQ
jgi:hypothetical protein